MVLPTHRGRDWVGVGGESQGMGWIRVSWVGVKWDAMGWVGILAPSAAGPGPAPSAAGPELSFADEYH